MNAPGHPTRCKPEYRCLFDSTLLGLALGRTASGNTTCGGLLFFRPLIAVRKNYLTRPAAAGGLTSQRKVVS